MSAGVRFYINYDSLKEKEDKIEKDYLAGDYWDDEVRTKLYNISGSNEVDLTFKALKITIIYWEHRSQYGPFRELLKKYKIEFQEESA